MSDLHFKGISIKNNPGIIGIGKDISISQQSATSSSIEEQLTSSDVVVLIEQITALLREESSVYKEEVIAYLGAAKAAVKEEQPNKNLIAANLGQAVEIIKQSDEVVNSGTNLWEKIDPLLSKLKPWLGIATSLC